MTETKETNKRVKLFPPKHTPYPWSYIKHKDGRFVIGTGLSADPLDQSVPIALAVIPAEIGGDDAERKANARLMAAAPELYHMLSSVIEDIQYATAKKDGAKNACQPLTYLQALTLLSKLDGT